MALMSESCMTDDAERNDREAADSGDHNLGYVLQQMGRSAARPTVGCAEPEHRPPPPGPD
jgi:hypothetical protein